MMRRALLAVLLLAPLTVSAQTVTAGGNPFAVLPKPCWPEHLLVGRDTLFAAMPCASLDVLPVGMRAEVDCLTARLDKGGWEWRIFETYRSNRRQQYLYSYGRTRPGRRVTNAPNAATTVHHYGLAVDVIHRTKLWNHPRFFYWVGQHAEACGMVAGAFWTKFPDQPHVQFGAWPGSPPSWARTLVRDSLAAVHRRVGASR